MTIEIRKLATFVEQTMIEGGRAAARPLTMVVSAAVLRNPWAGKLFTDDLNPVIKAVAPELGKILTDRLIAIMPGDTVEAFGKTAAVGVNGEVEHGSALIHTLRFGNIFRNAVGGTAYLEFTNTRVGPGALMSLPMIHKSETGRRSHFLTSTFQIADAPGPDEILIAIGAADGGRPHARLADRFHDIADMEREGIS